MRVRRRIGTLLLFVVAAVSSRRAAADPGEVSLAVLGIETLDVPPSVGDEVSEQLRQRVSAIKDYRLVAGKDLVEIKLVFSCADEAHSCMAQAGKSLGAEKLIYGSVKRQGNDYAVWLKLFDVKKESVESWVTDTLLKKQSDAPGIKAASGRWLAKLTGRPAAVGTLRVSANVFGATVRLDGNPVGVTGEQPLAVSDVSAGQHDVVIEKVGYAPGRQQVTIVAAQAAQVNLNLLPATGGPPPSTSEAAPLVLPNQSDQDDAPVDKADGRTGSRVGFWVTLAGTLASAGLALKYGLDVSSINDSLEPLRRFCDDSGAACVDATGAPAPVRTPAQQAEAEQLTADGERAQRLQWVFIGVGSAFAIASGYLFYRGYLNTDAGDSRREARRGLRIFPTASASSGGVLAEFDF